MRVLPVLAAILAIAAAALPSTATAVDDSALAKAVAAPGRSPQFKARDNARHPVQELEFFGIKPSMTVVEIWPGGGYWTEILAPYLHDKGTYIVASPPPAPGGEMGNAAKTFQAKLDSDTAVYGNVKTVAFGKGSYEIAPPGSVDLIVTFRNLHNWMEMGFADDAMAAFYKALKPGGILGIEDHRAATDQPQDPAAKSGYVREDYTIALAEKAGFKLVGKSEINANPKDPKDGIVWRLPPTFMFKDKDHDKYAAIGEADNFVLKFEKPKQ
jgi:predicted methyltransferase